MYFLQLYRAVVRAHPSEWTVAVDVLAARRLTGICVLDPGPAAALRVQLADPAVDTHVDRAAPGAQSFELAAIDGRPVEHEQLAAVRAHRRGHGLRRARRRWRRRRRPIADGRLRADVKLARLLIFGALNWSAQWYDRRKGATLDQLTQAAMALFIHDNAA